MRGLDSAASTDAVFSQALSLVTVLLPLTSSSPSGIGGVTRKALEGLVDKAAARAARPPRVSLTEAENNRVKDSFERVFVKAPPEWRGKFSPKKKKGMAGGGGGGESRPARSISIKGPKRKIGSEGGGGSGADPVAKKRSRG